MCLARGERGSRPCGRKGNGNGYLAGHFCLFFFPSKFQILLQMIVWNIICLPSEFLFQQWLWFPPWSILIIGVLLHMQRSDENYTLNSKNWGNLTWWQYKCHWAYKLLIVHIFVHFNPRSLTLFNIRSKNLSISEIIFCQSERHCVSMSAWFCPTTLAKFWRLVGCFKSR